MKSSTPVEDEGEEQRPHPLDLVEATPIRAPLRAEQSAAPAPPLSPQPQMVTGGLAKLCIIM